MTRAIVAAALLLGEAGLSMVADAAFAEVVAPPSVISRTVDSGADLVLSRPTFWNSACAARSITVTLIQPPANGTFSVTEGLNTANPDPKFGTAGRCGGMQIMGKQVIYRSTSGYHGSDVVIYEYVSDWGEKAKATVFITVR
jgi:hypothetical protein